MTATLATAPSEAPVRRRWITHWDPEDETFWARTGHRTARHRLRSALGSPRYIETVIKRGYRLRVDA
jgi:hypothetical protein